MPITHIALVGHCGLDSGTLKTFAQELAPDAEVTRVNSQATLDPLVKPGTLLLVNRLLDGTFETGGSGTELIRALSTRDDAPAMMLVSNYEEAQKQAMDAGALQGFGKSDIADPQTRDRLADTIAGL